MTRVLERPELPAGSPRATSCPAAGDTSSSAPPWITRVGWVTSTSQSVASNSSSAATCASQPARSASPSARQSTIPSRASLGLEEVRRERRLERVGERVPVVRRGKERREIERRTARRGAEQRQRLHATRGPGGCERDRTAEPTAHEVCGGEFAVGEDRLEIGDERLEGVGTRRRIGTARSPQVPDDGLVRAGDGGVLPAPQPAAETGLGDEDDGLALAGAVVVQRDGSVRCSRIRGLAGWSKATVSVPIDGSRHWERDDEVARGNHSGARKRSREPGP